jgi:CRP-like cAMP-binding protein
MNATTVLAVRKPKMMEMLRTQPALTTRLLSHLLARNNRIEEDLADQLFNSSEKRLARALLLLAHQLLHEQVPQAGVHRLQRRDHGQRLAHFHPSGRLRPARYRDRRAPPASPGC